MFAEGGLGGGLDTAWVSVTFTAVVLMPARQCICCFHDNDKQHCKAFLPMMSQVCAGQALFCQGSCSFAWFMMHACFSGLTLCYTLLLLQPEED